jgi:MFS family permease
MNLLNFVLLIVVFSLSKSNIAVAGVVLAFTTPSILFGVLAGAYVDKWNKKNVLVASNALRGLAAFPLVFISHQLFLVYSITFLVALFTQFFIPAETPIIPQLVPKKLLLSANALFSIGIFGTIIIAYALSGPIILLAGETNVFLIITAFFLISSFFAFLIRGGGGRVVGKIDLKQSIKDSFSLIFKKDKIYHSLFLLTLLQTLILVIAAIGPGYATEILHIQVEKFPILFVTPAMVGMALGAIIIGNFLHKHSKIMLAKIGLLITGIVVLFFPYGSVLTSREFIQTLNQHLPEVVHITNIHVMFVMAVLIGFAFSLIFVPSNTILQEETTDEQRGKIYGSLNTLVGLVSIFPVLGAGLLADLIGVSKVITLIGLSIIAISLLRFFKYK